VSRLSEIGMGKKALVAVFAVVLAALSIFLFALSWNPVTAGFLSDDAVYLLMADRFSPFHTAEPALADYVMRQSLFPPLYPLILAYLGGGSGSLLWSHVITTSTLVVALAAFGAWIHAETGDRWAAIVLVATYALLPGTLLHDLEILSEFPYLMFSLLALWFAERAENTQKGYSLVALFAGLSAVTRTAGVSLIVALALWLLRSRSRSRVYCLIVAIAPGFAWFVYRSLYVGQTSGGGYQQFWIDLLHQARDQGIVTFLPSFLATQFAALWSGFIGNLDLRSWPSTQVVAVIVVVAAIPAWIERLRRGRLDAWYLLVGGGMTLLYPFPNFATRLVMPWIPLLLLYFWLSVSRLVGSAHPGSAVRVGRFAATVVLAVAWVPSFVFIASRFAAPIDPELAHWKHTRYWFRGNDIDAIRKDLAFRQSLIVASRGIADHVPEKECVMTVHTAIAMLYGRRVAQQPPPPSVANFDARISACRYVLLVSSPTVIGGEHIDAFYPGARLPPDRVEFVQGWPDPVEPENPTAILLRLEPAT
jgi:hypothetical protein